MQLRTDVANWKAILRTSCCYGLALLWAASCAAQTANPALNPAQNPASISGDAPTASPLAADEAALRAEIAAHPDQAELLYRLGLMLRLEDKPKESLETYTRAAKLRKPDAGELRSVALDYVLLDDYTDAVHWLELAVGMEPGNVEVLYSLGRCYYSRGQFHEAEAMYLRVLQQTPDSLRAEENLGLAYDAENRPELAEPALRAAAGLADRQKSDEWPFLNLGAFLLDQGRAPEAVPFLAKAVSLAAKSALCHEKLGRALEESGKAAEGVKELETAVRLDPSNPNVHFELGHAYRQAGEMEKARTEFAESQRLRKVRDAK
jgi:tetratricopeptide (TPR) repeat protein